MFRVRVRHIAGNSLLTAMFLAGAALLPASAADDVASSKIPDFMQGGVGWNSAGRLVTELVPVPGSPSPVTQDPRVKYVANNDGDQPTWRYGDTRNPNLTQFAKDGLQKANQLVDEGFALYDRTARCWEPGVPVLELSPGRTYFLQTPKVVYIIWQRDQIVRPVYLNVPHTQNPKPSWNGESVGHYEGDTLVVDTIGQTTKTFADLFRTPHSEKLHVIERFRMIDGGKKLQVEMTVDDPVAFVKPWKGTKVWQKVVDERKEPGDVIGTFAEEMRCMDGEMINPLNQTYKSKLEPLPTDKDSAEQKHLSGN
jgi:hypothetical protein